MGLPHNAPAVEAPEPVRGGLLSEATSISVYPTRRGLWAYRPFHPVTHLQSRI